MMTAGTSNRTREDAQAAQSGPDGRRRRALSMRLIIGAAAVASVAATVAGVAWVAERNARAALTDEVETRLLLETRNLALASADALLSDYPELTLFPVVSEMSAARDDLEFVAVLDRDGRIQGHVDARRLGTPFTALADLRPIRSGRPLAAGERLLGDGTLLAATVPVALRDGQPLGTAVVGLRRTYLETRVRRARQALLPLAAALLAAVSAAAVGLMSWLLRPLRALRDGLARIGRGDLDSPVRLRDRTEIGLLGDAVNGMAAQLKVSQEQRIEKERLAHEMDLARSIQESLMPRQATQAGPFTVQGVYEAAAEVGGDYWDVHVRPDGRLGIVVADVAGKGLGGCLVTSMLAVLLRSLRDEGDSPAALIVQLERQLAGSLRPGVFVTLFCGLLDPQSGRLRFASAGHSPLLVWRARDGAVAWHRTKGIPLGAVGGGMLARTLSDHELVLEPGDLALQYTDGLTEAPGARDEEFGAGRAEDIVVAAARGGPEAVLAALRAGLADWTAGRPAADDLTLVAIARRPVAPPAGRRVGDDPAATADEPSRQMLAPFAAAPRLRLPARTDALATLGRRLDAYPGVAALSAADRRLAELCLYEICANIVEHGYGGDAADEIEIAWRDADESGTGGWFLVCERGRVYDPRGWQPPDFDDPEVRRRGRGLGLRIIHAAMNQVQYLPGTPAGNLTLLRFVPAPPPAKEPEHVRQA